MRESSRTESYLSEKNIRAKHALGQNFLIDETIYTKIISAATLTQREAVVEVGAGFGSLTRHLAQAAGQVVAIEYDGELVPLLKKDMAAFSHVHVLHADILRTKPEVLLQTFVPPQKKYIVVANLPYQITAKTLTHFLTAKIPPTYMVLMIQREVAERLAAEPGDLSMLALVTQWHARITKLFDVPSTAFSPAPKVTSSVVRLDMHTIPPVSLPKGMQKEDVFKIAKIGFVHKRKMLASTVSATLRVSKENIYGIFEEIGIQVQARPQELAISQWVALAKNLKKLA